MVVDLLSKLWNVLPEHVREPETFEMLKNNLKHFFYIMYFDSFVKLSIEYFMFFIGIYDIKCI